MPDKIYIYIYKYVYDRNMERREIQIVFKRL